MIPLHKGEKRRPPCVRGEWWETVAYFTRQLSTPLKQNQSVKFGYFDLEDGSGGGTTLKGGELTLSWSEASEGLGLCEGGGKGNNKSNIICNHAGRESVTYLALQLYIRLFCTLAIRHGCPYITGSLHARYTPQIRLRYR